MPALDEVDGFYLEQFWDLSTCRLPFGFAVGPIPHDKIRDHGIAIGLDEETLPIFIRTMRELDKVFLEWCEKEREANAKKDK